MPPPIQPITSGASPSPLRRNFSEPQLDLINVYLTLLRGGEEKVTSAKQSIGLFLDYLRKENGLSDVQWCLSIDSDGTPYMSGSPQK